MKFQIFKTVKNVSKDFNIWYSAKVFFLRYRLCDPRSSIYFNNLFKASHCKKWCCRVGMALSDMIMFLLYHFNIGKGERIMQNLPCAGAVDGGYQWRIFINLSSRPPISHTTVMTQPYKLSQHRKYWISPTFISTSVVTLLLYRVPEKYGLNHFAFVVIEDFGKPFLSQYILPQIPYCSIEPPQTWLIYFSYHENWRNSSQAGLHS